MATELTKNLYWIVVFNWNFNKSFSLENPWSTEKQIETNRKKKRNYLRKRHWKEKTCVTEMLNRNKYVILNNRKIQNKGNNIYHLLGEKDKTINHNSEDTNFVRININSVGNILFRSLGDFPGGKEQLSTANSTRSTNHRRLSTRIDQNWHNSAPEEYNSFLITE